LDPVAALPSPEECVERINAILESRKITFAPGSAEIDTDARETIDRIAEAMKECEEVAMEIGGHTDSQGREEMNERLSQNRADAVLSALLARRVLTSNLTARGYGEAEPIADNDTEEGREANRRIEFRLLPEGEATDTPEPEEDTAADGETPEDGEAVAGEPSAESEEDSD
jgi:OOP family OmpA-OmpF porin